MTEFERFREIAVADTAIREALLKVRDPEQFIEQVVQLARSRGCQLTSGEVRDALRFARRSWFERHVR